MQNQQSENRFEVKILAEFGKTGDGTTLLGSFRIKWCIYRCMFAQSVTVYLNVQCTSSGDLI